LRERWLDTAVLPEFLAFGIIFLSVFIAAKLVERIVKDIIERLHLAALDRALGLLFGLAKSLAVITLVLFVLSSQPLFDPSPLLGHSLFARFLLPLTGALRV
jgi:membrane protein required for colicin V production